MTTKFRYMEVNTRTGIISRVRKDMVGCFQAVVVGKKLLVQF